jgi:hypothetical protein
MIKVTKEQWAELIEIKKLLKMHNLEGEPSIYHGICFAALRNLVNHFHSKEDLDFFYSLRNDKANSFYEYKDFFIIKCSTLNFGSAKDPRAYWPRVRWLLENIDKNNWHTFFNEYYFRFRFKEDLVYFKLAQC